MPAFRDPESRANVIANPLPSAIWLNAGENVETGLEPIRDSLRDLHSLMISVVGGQHAVNHGLAAVNRQVGMQLNHGAMRRHHVGAVNLDFVVVLGEG